MPLMHPSFCGIPPLGLAQDGLVISFSIWVLSWICVEDNGGDLQNGKISFAWIFLALYFVFVETSIVAMLLNHGFVVGCRCQGMMKKSSMARALSGFLL